MRNTCTIILSILFILPIANGDYISNGFFVSEEVLDPKKTISSATCYETIPYPKFSHDDEELFARINNKINWFMESFANAICNRKGFLVRFDVPNSGTKDFFSVIWFTKNKDSLIRIDSLNFNTETGELLTPDNIFNAHSNHLMNKMIAISAGHLKPESTWDEFLEKIRTRDVQLYIKNDVWYIVFNSTQLLDNIVELKIPEYFLITRDDYDSQ